MDDETPREKIGIGVGLLGSILPGMILAGFMPAWDVLPPLGWIAIAAIAGAVGGAIATPRLGRGALSGTLAGGGAVVGIVAYVFVRSFVSDTFLQVEIAIGALIGAAPGVMLWSKWAREPRAGVIRA